MVKTCGWASRATADGGVHHVFVPVMSLSRSNAAAASLQPKMLRSTSAAAATRAAAKAANACSACSLASAFQISASAAFAS
jgi:hypothetical protein